MGAFRGFDNLNGDKQRESMKGWGPAPHCVVEPILYTSAESFDELRFLVCRRMKGALSAAKPPTCTTTNGGGHHVLVGTDDTPMDAVIRSVHKKLGYRIGVQGQKKPFCIGTFGPALNKADLKIEDGMLRLVIRDEPAEPEVPFIAHIFNVFIPNPKKKENGDGSLEEIGWLTIGEIVERFGMSGSHIYFQFLFQFLFGRTENIQASPAQFPDWRPGTYDLPINKIELKPHNPG